MNISHRIKWRYLVEFIVLMCIWLFAAQSLSGQQKCSLSLPKTPVLKTPKISFVVSQHNEASEKTQNIAGESTYSELRKPVKFSKNRQPEFKTSQELLFYVDTVLREQSFMVQRKASALKLLLSSGFSEDLRGSLLQIAEDLSAENAELFSALHEKLAELAAKQKLFDESADTLKRLSAKVTERIERLQRGPCAGALLCTPSNPFGFASGIHSAVFCLVRGFQLGKRVQIHFDGWHYLKDSAWDDYFQPLSPDVCAFEDLDHEFSLPGQNGAQRRLLFMLPDDLAEELVKHVKDPNVWWLGQFVKYILRPSNRTQASVTKIHESKASKRRIGLHIRRGDKTHHEARRFEIQDYMRFALEDLNARHAWHALQETQIFVATDDVTVVPQLKSQYKDFDIVDNNSSALAGSPARDSKGALEGLQKDIEYLASSDFIVCTLSSGICRLAVEIRTARSFKDISNDIISLDVPLFYAYVAHPPRVALYDHRGISEADGSAGKMLQLLPGDLITQRYDRASLHEARYMSYGNGFQIGRHLRSATQTGNPFVVWKTVPTLHVNSSWKILV